MHGKTVKWQKNFFSVCFLLSCHSNFPSKSSVKRLKTCKTLVPNTLLHTRMINELICVGMDPPQKKLVVSFQTSSIWNGMLKLYSQDIKGTIVNLYFFSYFCFQIMWEPSLLTILGVVFFNQTLSTRRGKAPLQGSFSRISALCRFRIWRVSGRASPSWLRHRLMFFCAQRGILRQMVRGLRDLFGAAPAKASVGGSAAAHLMTFIL